jgi:hypothetical protein
MHFCRPGFKRCGRACDAARESQLGVSRQTSIWNTRSAKTPVLTRSTPQAGRGGPGLACATILSGLRAVEPSSFSDIDVSERRSRDGVVQRYFDERWATQRIGEDLTRHPAVEKAERFRQRDGRGNNADE